MRKTIYSLLMLLGIVSFCSCGGYSFDDSKFTGKGILGDYPKALAMQESLLHSVNAKYGDINEFGNYGNELTPTEKKLADNISDMSQSLKELETNLNNKKGIDITFKSKWKISLNEVKADIDSEYASRGYITVCLDVYYDSTNMFGTPLYNGKQLPKNFKVKFLDAQGNVIKETTASRPNEFSRSPGSIYEFTLGEKKAFSKTSSDSDDTPIYSKEDEDIFESNINYLSQLDKIVKIEVEDNEIRPGHIY